MNLARISVLATLGLAMPMVTADAQRVAISARASTLGPGAELAVGLTRKLNLRVGANMFSYQRQDEVEQDIKLTVDSDAKLSSATAILDFRPFANFLRLSAGAVLNQNEGEFLITPAEAYTMDEKEFSPEKIGTITTNVDWEKKVAPYVGVGFGNPLRRRVGLTLDVGAVYAGAPRVTMVGTNMIAPTAAQAAEIQDAAKDLKWIPVVSLGLSLKLY